MTMYLENTPSGDFPTFESYWGFPEEYTLWYVLLGTLLVLVVSYLIGSIPFGYILTKFSGRGDIRDIGSGNIGDTNVLRTGSKKLAIFTLLGDLLKGFIPVYCMMQYGGFFCWGHLMVIIPGSIMVLVILGHMFPVWLKFKGGKGVATYAGALLALSPALGGIAMAIWLLTLLIFRYSSLAALVSTASIVPIVLFQFPIRTDGWPVFSCSIIAALIWWRHKDNIQRLLKGTEPKVGKS